MKLYHGSTTIVGQPQILISDHCLDFGYGFYTTTNVEQAIRWANIKKQRVQSANACLNSYEIEDTVFSNKSFRLLEFKEPDREWLEFIINNRRGKALHDYDIVKGAVANDSLYQSLALYEAGVLTVEETVVRLKVHHLFDQISFHSEGAIQKLKFVKSEDVTE
ncbi:hypothetical protein AGMMS49525_05220 [Bacteroidia bacterium]|nr:hypothetical protein AGMMS49525_05220 [Bacteroidia bacterium]